jgi:hypothetical protein
MLAFYVISRTVYMLTYFRTWRREEDRKNLLDGFSALVIMMGNRRISCSSLSSMLLVSPSL